MSTWNPTKSGPESNRRRSQRAILSLPITVRIEDGSLDAPHEEATQTLVVNAHGALIAIAGKVEKGQKVRLTNRTTQQECTCRVMYLGPVSGGKTQVGVEFDEPSPTFWRMTFPPDDWAAPEQEPAASKGKK
jgi:PilZ domain